MPVAILLIAAGFWAEFPAEAGFSRGDAVTLGGEEIFRIPSSYDGFSPEHRAWVVQDNLDNALAVARNTGPVSVQVERRNGASVVTLNGRLIVTADGLSAQREGRTASDLAETWAARIRSFLADPDKTVAYIDSLRARRNLNAEVAVVERRLFAPPGTKLPVVLKETISSENAVAGDLIIGTVMQDVPIGSYIIPQGSALLGEFVETRPGSLIISFRNLRLANGSEVPINAVVAANGGADTNAAHPVCTLGMPAAPGSVCRVPAIIGIGASGSASDTVTALLFERGSSMTIAAGRPVDVMFENPTPIAVVVRGNAM